MNDDLIFTFKRVTECISALTIKQGLILDLLAKHLPDLSDDMRTKLKDSAQANGQISQTLDQELAKL